MLGATGRMALASLLEAVLNRALLLDPPGRDRLLDSLEPPVSLELIPTGQRLQLSRNRQALCLATDTEIPAAVRVRGTPLGLLAVLQGDRTPLEQERVVIEGDTAQVQLLRQALQSLDLDWEASLAGQIGDVPAHFIGRRVRGTLAWLQRTHRRLFTQVEAYLQEEAGSLPPRGEVEAFWEEVDETRLQVDRLEARLQRLEQRQSHQQVSQ